MIEPKKPMFVIHFDDKRGSRVRAADGQKLAEFSPQSKGDKQMTHPATSSGQAIMIFVASSCCLASSLTLRVLRMLARILL